MRKNHIVFTKCSILIILFTGVLLPELSAALTDNLKGYWRFESPSWFAANEVCSWIGADNEVTDSSFSGSDGTANNFGQSTVSGKVGHAASFDGLTRFITVNSINQSSWANGTISLWMKTSVTSDPDVYQYLFQRGTGARPELAIRETGLFRFGIYDGTTNYTLYSSTGYNDNQWHQVTVTWGSGGMKMYVDGALVSSNTFTGTFQNIEAPWYIGAKNAGGSNYFNGSIDEVAIWSRALSSAEVTTLYNSGNGSAIAVGPSITTFQTDKMIYKPNDTITFNLSLNSPQAYSNANIKVLVENGLNSSVQVYNQNVNITSGQQNITNITWQQSQDIFGHDAWVKITDSSGRLMATARTFFDVTANWQNVMRYASNNSGSVTPTFADSDIYTTVALYRNIGLNTVEFFHVFDPYNMAPTTDTWQDIDTPSRTISKERIQKWGEVLHDNGMKFVAYNETSAIIGPDTWKMYYPAYPTLFAVYYASLGYFSPNPLLISDCFANTLSDSITMFGWDGVLMDSCTYLCLDAPLCKDSLGNPITTLSPGELGLELLSQARQDSRSIKSDFALLSQNATSISNIGVEQPINNIYNWINTRATAQEIYKHSSVVDLYTTEMDSSNTPQDGRYPLYYDIMSVSLNSVVSVTGRPLMQWAFLTSASVTDITFIRPYMAIHLASRTKVDDHNLQYNGAGNYSGKRLPASWQFVQYSQFAARYSWIIYNPALVWVQNATATMGVTSSSPLFWSYTVYSMPLPNGHTQYVVNLLNLPANNTILNQTTIPPVASNVTFKITKSHSPVSIVCLNADDYYYGAATVPLASSDATYDYYNIAPVKSWKVLVVECLN